MTGAAARDSLVAELADWLYIPGPVADGGLMDIDGGVEPFGREQAQWALARLGDSTLAALSRAVLGQECPDSRRPLARRALAFTRDVLAAADVRVGGRRPGLPADSHRELRNFLAFADVVDASIAARREANAWLHHSFMLWDALDHIGDGRASGWRPQLGSSDRLDWFRADPDELDEARARVLICLLAPSADKPDQQLVALFLANLSRARELAAVVIERDTLDPELITDVLAADSPALAGGTL